MVGNDAIPTFEAKTLPAGTAPPESTFQPNPINETPGQANNPDALAGPDKEATNTGALDFPGATSADVHTGYGHPGQGQVASDKERKTAGLQGGSGIEQAGETVETGDNAAKDATDIVGAEERLPESAEGVATERTGRERQDRGT